GGGNILAFDLTFDQLEHPLANLVAITRRLEAFARGLREELDRKLELRGTHVDLLERNLVERADLVSVLQLLEEEPGADRPHHDEVHPSSGGISAIAMRFVSVSAAESSRYARAPPLSGPR